MTDIAERLTRVRERIEAAASGREVTLVAVSKRKPATDIAAAHAAGCVDFGENYVQELVDKRSELSHLGCRWHFIGHLQRNKVKDLLAAQPALIHGVDSERLLREIDKRAPHPCPVLLQVNVAAEDAKSGCDPSETAALVALAADLPRVTLSGLMTMPPFGDPEEARPHFRALRELAESIGRDKLPELSMGMSNDYVVAIEEGATIVRVGSAIFGARE